MIRAGAYLAIARPNQ